MKFLLWIALSSVIIGGLNWGLVGLAHFNLINAVFGEASLTTRIIYCVIALSAVMLLANFKKLV